MQQDEDGGRESDVVIENEFKGMSGTMGPADLLVKAGVPSVDENDDEVILLVRAAREPRWICRSLCARGRGAGRIHDYRNASRFRSESEILPAETTGGYDGYIR